MKLFIKYKQYIDLAYLWKHGDKFFVPCVTNFKMIENDENEIMSLYNKCEIDKKLKMNYIGVDYIEYTENSARTARTNATYMFHYMMCDKYMYGESLDMICLAQKRYIEISFANTRILNLLKITHGDKQPRI